MPEPNETPQPVRKRNERTEAEFLKLLIKELPKANCAEYNPPDSLILFQQPIKN